MATSRKQACGGRDFLFPIVGITVLLACYWVLADWQEVPALINSALASVPWPD
ncbi:MAG TPA: hypothetical protein VGC09_15915 [Rhodopila sp.]